MEEISLKGKFSLELIKKERFAGSFCGMRYMLMMEDGKMKATVYPEPYCWEATPKEQKESELFPHTKEGIDEMVAWLNQDVYKRQGCIRRRSSARSQER